MFYDPVQLIFSIMYIYYAENVSKRLVPDLFLLFKKASYEVKASGLQLSFNIFRQPSTWLSIKTFWSRDMLNFDFIEIDLVIVPAPHFVYDFSANMFLLLYSINLRNFNLISGNMCLVIVFSRMWRHKFWN